MKFEEVKANLETNGIKIPNHINTIDGLIGYLESRMESYLIRKQKLENQLKKVENQIEAIEYVLSKIPGVKKK